MTGEDALAETASSDDAHGPTIAGTVPAAPADGLVLAAGTRIQQYELIRMLGAGGMGQVFLARDTKLGRRVAIKFLRSRSQAFTDRFLAEARTTARLSHEHIVVIHDVSEERGTPFMVLEYLEGQSLGAAIAQRRLPASQAIELIVPVVAALVRAHEAGIIHRDLKPENVFVTAAGTVKVLDFGIAKLFGEVEAQPGSSALVLPSHMTQAGALVGTLPYMSPEQWGADEVDHRSDLWAVGIILHEMMIGAHPLAPISHDRLATSARELDTPLPGVEASIGALGRVIDRCLAKRKAERYASARELLDELEALRPERYLRRLAADENPYPGLVAFQEADANRFFGRAGEIAQLVKWVRDRPLIGIAGPSGAGKSSFVRAGLVPVLKASGESWEVFTLRPGRRPLAALAEILASITRTGSQEPTDHEALATRLRTEPGYLGLLLRGRATRNDSRIVVYVDQLEELYTLVEPEERACFVECLLGLADDASAPVRVLVSIRSDFPDRVAGHRRFVDELSKNLYFLPPAGRDQLRDALVEPAALAGYRFEDRSIVEAMLDSLERTQGALPLLQFAASRLWETRDRDAKVFTRRSYDAIGGIAGALSGHADHVLAAMSEEQQRLARELFQRLVTPDRTRAIVDVEELTAETQRLVDQLVEARLLVVQRAGGARTIEIVHESLIATWPTLRRWLDDSHEDVAFLAQLRDTAKQWDQRGRPVGLLWTGSAAADAQLWRARSTTVLTGRELDYYDAVRSHAVRALTRKRRVLVGIIGVLATLVVIGAIAIMLVLRAQREAMAAADRATKAEQATSVQLKEVMDQEVRRKQLEEQKQLVEAKLGASEAQVGETAEKLKQTNAELMHALETAHAAEAAAKARTAEARAAQTKLEALLKEQLERARRMEQLLGKTRGDLK